MIHILILFADEYYTDYYNGDDRGDINSFASSSPSTLPTSSVQSANNILLQHDRARKRLLKRYGDSYDDHPSGWPSSGGGLRRGHPRAAADP